MSAATGSSQIGRPAGPGPETLERQRRVHAMRGNGLTPSMIAECERISEAYVRMLLKESPSTELPASPVEALPRPLSRRTLLDRAWEATHYFPMNIMSNAERYAWMEAVMIICNNGDGTEVCYGPRSQVRDMAHFCQGIGLAVDDLKRWIEDGLIVELPDAAGLALPHNRRLRPWEARRRAPASLVGPSARAQREMLHVLPGGRSHANETPLPTQGKPPSDANETPLPTQGKPPSDANEIAENEFSPQQNPAAKSTTTTTTKTLESLISGGGGGTFLSVPPAHESANETPLPTQGKPPSDANEIPPDPAARLAGEVAALCGYGEPKAVDVDTAREWLAFPGVSEELIMAAVHRDRAKPNPPPVYRLSLFTGEIRGALSQAKSAADKATAMPVAVALPAVPPTAEELLRNSLRERWDRWFNGNPTKGIAKMTGPQPPKYEGFKPCCDGGARQAAAQRWLDIWDAWYALGLPRDVEPPGFAAYLADPDGLESDMLACEETLSSPDGRDG